MKALKILFLFFLGLCINVSVLGSVEKKDSVTAIGPVISLSYLNLSNDTIVLTANLFVKKEQGMFAIENAMIEFFVNGGDETRKIGQSITDNEGNAVFKICTRAGLPADKEGKSTYTARFTGQGKYLSATETISAKQVKLTVNFSKVDTIRYILIAATQTEKDGKIGSAGKLSVNIYIPRLFTDLKIGELTLGEDGTGKLEYPGGIIGDSIGNIIVIAKIEDNDLFGNVQARSSISWGIPKQYYLAEMPSRELWDTYCPSVDDCDAYYNAYRGVGPIIFMPSSNWF